MVIKKENFKETEIFLNLESKQLDKDIKEILNIIDQNKKKPFHDIFLFVPELTEKNYLNKLLQNVKYREIGLKNKTLVIKI
jgi:hypothetical protein